MTMEHLPSGGVVVTFGDEPQWTPRDAFVWAAFKEWRFGDRVSAIVFPRDEWSRDWGYWPPGNLLAALNEIATGLPWQPGPGSLEEAGADEDRTHARKLVEQTAELAGVLSEELSDDMARYRAALADYQNGREDVMNAVRDGRLQVWARKAHGPGNPNHDAVPERMHTRLFTHQERHVGEDGWVQGTGDYNGPWWDQARFDADQLRAIWPAIPRGDGIAAILRMPQPFPDAERVGPWLAITWRAFGNQYTPGHILNHRSFDQGTDRLPDETKKEFEHRVGEHRRFDDAEREVMGLLSAARVTAKGLPPLRDGSGRHLDHPAITPVDIPAATFLNQQLAFDADGSLVVRAATMNRIFPPRRIRGTDADPGLPIYYDVLVNSAELATAWKITASLEPIGTKANRTQPTLGERQAILLESYRKPKTAVYSAARLGAWFMLRVDGWDPTQPFPTEIEDLQAAIVEFGKVPRDPFRVIRREKTPPEWHKSGPRGPRN